MNQHSIQTSMTEKLKAAFQPTHLELVNESHKHHRNPKGETHFHLVLVSQAFEGKKLLQRHRMVQELFELERSRGLHALTLVTKTPAEWAASAEALKSPSCKGSA